MPSATDAICPVCRGRSVRDVPKRARELQLPDHLGVRQCTACTHAFLAPFPTPEELSAFYAEAGGYAPGTLGGRLDGMRPQYLHVLRTLERHGAPGRELLDFGCGEGAFLASARDAGWSAKGYEPTVRLAEAVRAEGIPVHSEPRFEDAPIEPGSLDAIHTSHALEHVPDPVEVLARFAKLLRPRGVLSVQVPNQFRDLLWPLLHERWITRGKPLGYHIHHLQFFTVRSLERLVGDAGFEVLEASTRFALRNRRTVAQGRNPAVRAAKALTYRAAGRVGRGPHIELFARRPG